MTTRSLKTCPDGACTTVPQGFGSGRSLPESAPTLVAIVDAGLGLLVDNLFTWQRRRVDRLRLQSLDDHMLRDIGLSRADVDAEATKPFWRP
jgi:uncharacterized protein YjiS (DUF1127 family)